MGPTFDDRNSEGQASALREPLVDIPLDDSHAEAEEPPTISGRKRLSKTAAKADVPREEPRRARRRLLEDVAEPGPAEPEAQPAPLPKARRSRLKRTESQVAVLESEEAMPRSEPSFSDESPPNATPQPQSAPVARVRMDRTGIDKAVSELRARQSMFMALVGGLLAVFVGAMIWATVAAVTDYHCGLMAVALGALVGGAVRVLGHGLERPYGCLGAAMALFGCVLGSLLSACMIMAQRTNSPPATILTQLDAAMIPDLLAAAFHPLDVVFYLIAVCEGYCFSFRKITKAEINRVMQIFGR